RRLRAHLLRQRRGRQRRDRGAHHRDAFGDMGHPRYRPDRPHARRPGLGVPSLREEMRMVTTIKAEALTKRYDDHPVVDNLTLDIAAGEVFGLLGPNGAGKTTTILMLLGLVEPSSGDIEVLGMDPRRHPLEVKRRVGFLPDAVGFYDTMTGRENLRFTMRLNGIEVDDRAIDALLDEAGILYAADQRVGEYSRGMKQRLGLADALIKRPGVLILDEPT